MITLCVGVCASLPFKQHEEDILLGAEVLHCGRPSANLTPKDVVEDLSHILLTLVVTDKEQRLDKAEVNACNTMENTIHKKVLQHASKLTMQSG